MNTYCQYTKVIKVRKIHKFSIGLGLLLVYALFSQTAHADAMETCNQTANAVNRSTPIEIDQITVIDDADCILPTTGKPILRYWYTLAFLRGDTNQDGIDSLKPDNLESWCSREDLRALFEILDVRYVYSDRVGDQIGYIEMSVSECSS